MFILYDVHKWNVWWLGAWRTLLTSVSRNGVTAPRRAMVVNPWWWWCCVIGTRHTCHEHITLVEKIRFSVSATLYAENPANSLKKHCYCHLQGRQFGHGKSNVICRSQHRDRKWRGDWLANVLSLTKAASWQGCRVYTEKQKSNLRYKTHLSAQGHFSSSTKYTKQTEANIQNILTGYIFYRIRG